MLLIRGIKGNGCKANIAIHGSYLLIVIIIQGEKADFALVVVILASYLSSAVVMFTIVVVFV